MNIFRDDSDSVAEVEPLESTDQDGKPYQRSAAVEAELGRILLLSHSDWIREARKLHHETLVHLIRHMRLADPELCGELTAELSKRIVRIARKYVRGRDRLTAEDVILKVELDILQLVLAETSSRKADFLETGFIEAIACRVSNELRNYQRTPMGHRSDFVPGEPDEDGEEIRRPIEFVPDPRAGPEALLSQSDDMKQRSELLDRAFAAVENACDVQAAFLHHGEGLPIESNDPDKDDVVSHVDGTARQLKYRIRKTMEIMRDVLGVQRNDEE